MKSQIRCMLSLMTAIAFIALLSSCDQKSDNNEEVPVDKNEKALRPSEEKQYLIDTGLELSEKIKANDFKNLIELAAYFEEQYGDSELDDNYVKKIEDKYGDDDEDYASAFRLASPISAVAGMIKVANAMVIRPGQGIRMAKNAYAVTAYLSDFYGGFSPRHQSDGSYCWKWDDSINDRIEVTFTDQDSKECVATLKGSPKTINISVSYDWEPTYKGYGDDSEKDDPESEQYIIKVPESMTFTFTQGGQKVIDFTLDVEGGLTFSEKETNTYEWYEDYGYGYWDWIDEQYSFSLDFSKLCLHGSLTVSNYSNSNGTSSYTESFGTEVTTNGAIVTDKVSINKESLLDSKVIIKGDFANLNSILNDAANDEVDEDDITERFNDMTATVSIMGKVHVDFSCPDIDKFYDAASYLDKCYEENFTRWTTATDALNKTYAATFYNTNSKVAQGHFYMEPQQEEQWDYTENMLVPVIEFCEDGSIYDISKYLNKDDFDAVISAFERIGEDFERMVEKAFD